MSPHPTIHIVYTTGNRRFPPDAVGIELEARFQANFEVKRYNYTSQGAISPSPGDILIGHPSYRKGHLFENSLRQSGWAKKIALCPFSPGDPMQAAYLSRIITRVDWFAAITGPYWFSQLSNTLFAHFEKKIIHIDLAVNTRFFQPVKQTYSAPRSRSFLYIGHTSPFKNTAYLGEIAAALPEAHFVHVGRGNIPGFEKIGRIDFQSKDGKKVINNADFLITAGDADANPTTILEAMAWGLIPICTAQSGYPATDSIINIPLNDVPRAINTLRPLLHEDPQTLLKMASINRHLLQTHYNWERFYEQILRLAKTNRTAPRLPTPDIRTRLLLRCAHLLSDHNPGRSTALLRNILSCAGISYERQRKFFLQARPSVPRIRAVQH